MRAECRPAEGLCNILDLRRCSADLVRKRERLKSVGSMNGHPKCTKYDECQGAEATFKAEQHRKPARTS